MSNSLKSLGKAPLSGRFAELDSWVFDLDNTLYPPTCDLFAQVDQRMCAFIADYLSVDLAEAKRLQKTYYIDHGTTLAGLMSVHGLEPSAFLDYVHEIDVGNVAPHPELGEAIAALPGRKLIFTNGSERHAENVVNRLGIAHVFDGIYDIVATDYAPKPRREAYEAFLRKSGVAAKRAAMFEDIARNLLIPHDMGMTTIWVRPGEPGPERHQQLSHDGADGPHVHHTVDDLTEFLRSINPGV